MPFPRPPSSAARRRHRTAPARRTQAGTVAPMPKTLFDRIWETHVVREAEGEPDLLYIDLHLVHEVTSPQAFEGLRLAGRAGAAARPDARDDGPQRPDGRRHAERPARAAQLDALRRNCEEFGVPLYATGSGREGIVHVIGPELGLTQPGMTIVCGDWHTSTHGAFGALAFGIGTSEVEHVLATQTLPQRKPRTMRSASRGELPLGRRRRRTSSSPTIGRLGVDGGVGHVIEYAGPAIEALSMEGRLTICNMSIEAGARAGLIAPDETTFAYLEGRPGAPKGADWERALDALARRCATDDDARLRPRGRDRRRGARAAGDVGHEPGHGRADRRRRARPGRVRRRRRARRRRARARVHGARAGNADPRHRGRPRLHRLVHELADRGPARRGRGRRAGKHVHPRVRAMVVPGSAPVKRQAEAEGLDRVFVAAGFEWRRAGCSMCLGMNPDVLAPGERCASTSNRNFEGRQGARRAHAPRQPRGRRRDRDRRPLRRRARAGGVPA